MAWGAGTFVADGGGYLWHSTDGITWRQGTASPQRGASGEGFDGIMWNGERFIGWGVVSIDNEAGTYEGYVWHSTDGITWTKATIEGQEAFSGVAGDARQLVAVTNRGTFFMSP